MNKKYILLLLCFVLFLTGCTANNPILTTTEDFSSASTKDSTYVPTKNSTPVSTEDSSDTSQQIEFDISARYTCFSDYHKNSLHFIIYPEAIPSITFFDDETCELVVDYFGGADNVTGVYNIESDLIYVEVDLSNTVFASDGNRYMRDQYIFEIIDSDTLIINGGFHTAKRGDLFVRLPEDSFSVPTEDSSDTSQQIEFDIWGKYICFSDYHRSEYSIANPEGIPSITFYDDGTCELVVNYFEGVDDVAGIYKIESDLIYVELDFTNTIFQGTGIKYMYDQYIFQIIDNDTLIIDREFYSVYAGDLFVRLSN